RARSGAAAAPAEKVDAQDAIATAVECTAGSDDVAPPAFLGAVIHDASAGGNTAKHGNVRSRRVTDQSPRDPDVAQPSAKMQRQGLFKLQHALADSRGSGLGHSIHESNTPYRLQHRGGMPALDRF